MIIYEKYFLKSKIDRCATVILLIFSLLIIRLSYLQLIQGEYFLHQSKKNFLRTEKVMPLRGNILDCNGTLIATNIPVINVYWQGTGNRMLTAEQKKLCQTVCRIGNFDYATEIEKIHCAEKSKTKKLIIKNIPFKDLCLLEELYPHNQNVVLEVSSKRMYPFGSYASHLIGYLGNITQNAHGIMGIEKIENNLLKGTDGTLLKVVNSKGTAINQEQIEPELPGEDIHTTLNMALQKIAEEVFPENRRGTILILDPHHGDIKALVSKPGFNSNIFLDAISPHQWEILQHNQPFLNRATQGNYAIGSVFKLITVSAALENNLISVDSNWYCKGFFYYGKRKYLCHNQRGHGFLSTQEAVAHSCNILFFDIGTKIDIDLIASYAHKFGLGMPTGILLPEKTGIVPSRLWKYKNRGEPWWQGETLSVTIGQSFLLATPLQVARMIGSIFTGYLVRPRILLNESIDTVPLDIQEDTRQFLIASMKSVVEQGTGKRISSIKDINVYAKTSTAQVSNLSKRRDDIKNLEHGWLVAFVEYKDYDPFVLVIVVEHAGSAQIPTTISKKFLIAYKNMLETQ